MKNDDQIKRDRLTAFGEAWGRGDVDGLVVGAGLLMPAFPLYGKYAFKNEG